MAFDVREALRFEAVIDKTKYERGMREIESRTVSAGKKTRELGVEYRRLDEALGVVGKGAAAAGAGLVGMVTAGLAMSPQLKSFFLGLRKPLFELGDYVGGELSPLFDSLTDGVSHLVDVLTEVDQRYGVIRSLSAGASGVITLAMKYDDQTGGLLSVGLVGVAGAGLVNWLAGKMGVSSGLLRVTPTGIVVSLVLAVSYVVGQKGGLSQVLPGPEDMPQEAGVADRFLKSINMGREEAYAKGGTATGLIYEGATAPLALAGFGLARMGEYIGYGIAKALSTSRMGSDYDTMDMVG